MTFSNKILAEKLDVVRLSFYTAPISLACLAPFFWIYEVRLAGLAAWGAAGLAARLLGGCCQHQTSVGRAVPVRCWQLRGRGTARHLTRCHLPFILPSLFSATARALPGVLPPARRQRDPHHARLLGRRRVLQPDALEPHQAHERGDDDGAGRDQDHRPARPLHRAVGCVGPPPCLACPPLLRLLACRRRAACRRRSSLRRRPLACPSSCVCLSLQARARS